MVMRRRINPINPVAVRKTDGVTKDTGVNIIQDDMNQGKVKGLIIQGKDAKGRFVPGNRCGNGGSMYRAEQTRVRNMIRSELPDNELRAFVRDWIKHARSGRGIYLVSLMERLCGKVADHATEERIQEMEAELERMLQQQPIVEL